MSQEKFAFASFPTENGNVVLQWPWDVTPMEAERIEKLIHLAIESMKDQAENNLATKGSLRADELEKGA